MTSEIVYDEQEECEIVGSNGQDIHDVHCSLEEAHLVWSPRQPDEELQGEVGDAEGLYHGQKRVVYEFSIYIC